MAVIGPQHRGNALQGGGRTRIVAGGTMLVVNVDRKTWARGQGAGKSCLLGGDGLKCCIGFACEAAGVEAEAMLGYPVVASLVEPAPCGDPAPLERCQLPAALLPLVKMGVSVDNTAAADELYRLNDDEEIDDEERERELTAGGQVVGIRFVFHG